jgi:hypothetical protein
MPDHAASAEVIGDRYLTSPSRLRARPYGPLDALDTHAGRAAQVRIVFLPGEWDAGELTDTVARWCAIGEPGVVGVLDFGRHADRWFLVLPPTLGTPVERWRSMRHPSGADAAQLALGFGRLLEAVSAAGFELGRAELADFAVGPGPTPFLEQPLFTSPGAPASIRRRAGGQRMLAALFDAALAEPKPDARLVEWRDAAREEAHGSLGACLNALEGAAAAVRSDTPESEPAGLAGIFDSPLLAVPGRLERLRRAAGPIVLAVAVLAALAALLGAPRARSGAAPPAPARAQLAASHAPAAAPGRRPAPASPRRRAHAKAAPAHRRRHRAEHAVHRSQRPARSQPAAPPTSPTPPAPPSPPAPTPAPNPTPSSGAGGGAVLLPTPGGTVLPAP